MGFSGLRVSRVLSGGVQGLGSEGFSVSGFHGGF